MTVKQGDFSEGKVSRIILRLGIPLTLAELVHVLYNIVDRMYIGRMEGDGTLALTGLGVSFPLITLIGAFTSLFSTGGATLCTIARGGGDQKKAEGIQDTAFTSLLLAGLILTAALYLSAPVTLMWLGGDDLSLPYALRYFRLYVLGTVPVMISLGMNPFINAQGFPKIGMVTVVLGAAMNIALDPLLIYTLGMGVAGAALATVISQTASALWVLIFLRSARPNVRLGRIRIKKEHLGGMLHLGLTGFTFKMTNSVTQAIVNMMLKTWGGALSTLYIGAMSLINSIREIVSLPANGITGAGQNVASFNYGAKQYRRVSQSIRFTLLFCLSINFLMWAMIMFFPRSLIMCFTEDESLIALTISCARIYFGAFPFMALQSSGQTTFVALNRPRHALFFSLLRKIFLIAPLTLVLPGIGLGVNGVFWAEFISQVVGASACFITMTLVVWRKLDSSDVIKGQSRRGEL